MKNWPFWGDLHLQGIFAIFGYFLKVYTIMGWYKFISFTKPQQQEAFVPAELPLWGWVPKISNCVIANWSHPRNPVIEELSGFTLLVGFLRVQRTAIAPRCRLTIDFKVGLHLRFNLLSPFFVWPNACKAHWSEIAWLIWRKRKIQLL